MLLDSGCKGKRVVTQTYNQHRKKCFNFLYYSFACIIKNILYLCIRFRVFLERLSSRRAKLAIIVYNENHDGEDGTNLESRHNGKAFIRRFIFDSKKSSKFPNPVREKQR